MTVSVLPVWIAFLVYCGAAVGLGFAARGRRDRGDAFWTANRDLSAASVGLSISAGFLSVSWSCVYAVQLFYWHGLGGLWLITIPWILALLGIYGLSQRYHDLAAFSQPEMVAARFGLPARRLVAVALAFVFLVWAGAEIYVAARLLAPQLRIGVPAGIAVIAAVVGAYSVLGGFRAVVSTDKMQYGLVAGYILAMGWLAARGLQDGGHAVWPPLGVRGARSGRPWTDWLAPGGATIGLTLAAYLPGWLFETDLWIRVQAARDTPTARRGLAIAVANSALFVGVLPLFIGIAALALFPMTPEGFPPAIGHEADAVFVALVERYAPAWFAPLAAVGLAAAAMSTIDTCINVMALSVAYDLLSAPGRPPEAAQRIARWATGGATLGAALFALGTESLWDIFYLSSGVLTVAVAYPVAAVFLPRVRPASAIASSACGLAAIIGAYFLEAHGPLAAWEPDWLAATGVGFVVWGVAGAAAGAIAGQLAGRTEGPCG